MDFWGNVRYCERMGLDGFGPRLRRTREQMGVGLRELSRRSGIGLSTLQQWETGKRWDGKAPPGDDVKKIAQALGVGVDELLGLSETGVQPAPLPPPRPARQPDGKFDRRAIIEYVEAWPDPIFYERLMREKEARGAESESYFRLCLRTFRLWTANFNGVLETAEEFRGEIWDQESTKEDDEPTDVSDSNSAIGK